MARQSLTEQGLEMQHPRIMYSHFQQQLKLSGLLSHMQQSTNFLTKSDEVYEVLHLQRRDTKLQWTDSQRGSASGNGITVSPAQQGETQLRRLLAAQRRALKQTHTPFKDMWFSDYGLVECAIVQSGRSVTLNCLIPWYLQDCESYT